MTTIQNHHGEQQVAEPGHVGHRGPAAETPAPSGAGASVPRTRMGELWLTAVAFAAVLLVLLIFVLENGQRAEVSFFGAHGHLPMGVALLLAAVFGILLVALPGTARIVQLRVLSRRRATAAADMSTEADGSTAPAGVLTAGGDDHR